MFYIKKIDVKKDTKLMEDIVIHEDRIFGEASIGRWNIKPFAKYGKIYVMVKTSEFEDEDKEEELVSVVEILPSFEPETAYIYGVSTAEKYENQGHMKKLLKYVLEELEKSGISKVELTVDTEARKVQKFYEKLGFEITEELENEYGKNINRYLMKYTKNTLTIK